MYKSIFVLLVLSVVKNVLGTLREVSIIQIDSRMAITEKFIYTANLNSLPIVSFYLPLVFTMPLNSTNSLPVIDSVLADKTNYDGDNIVFATLECDSPTPTYWIYNKSTPTLNVFDLNTTTDTPIRLLLDWSRLVNQNHILCNNIKLTNVDGTDIVFPVSGELIFSRETYNPSGTIKLTSPTSSSLHIETLAPLTLTISNSEDLPYFATLSISGDVDPFDQSVFKNIDENLIVTLTAYTFTLTNSLNNSFTTSVSANPITITLNVSNPTGPIYSETQYTVDSNASTVSVTKYMDAPNVIFMSIGLVLDIIN